MTSSTTRPRSVQSVTRVAYAIVAVIAPALLVVFLVGSLIFSGAQVSETMDPKWGVVWAYPLFAVPTAVLVALGCLLVVLAVILAVTARSADVPALRGLIGPTAASIVAAVGFALLVPEGGTRSGDLVLGDQWLAAVVYGGALVVLLIAIAIRRRPADDRPRGAR